jgi:hypothetical protein
MPAVPGSGKPRGLDRKWRTEGERREKSESSVRGSKKDGKKSRIFPGFFCSWLIQKHFFNISVL